MKFTSALLVASAAAAMATPIAPDSPVVGPEARALEARAGQSCKVARRFLPDLHGICVDTTKAHPCDNGRPFPGLHTLLFLTQPFPLSWARD